VKVLIPIWAKSSFSASSKYYASLYTGYALSSNQASQFGYVYDTVTPTNSFAHITPYGSSEGSKFMVRADGNVGIGTTSPLQKLHVEGLSYFSSDIFTVNNGGIFFSGNSSYGRGIYSNASGLTLQTLSSPKVTINDSGNVGIGTTSPTTKLSLNGYSGARLSFIQDTTFSIDSGGITIGSSTTNGNKAGGLDLTNNSYGVGYYSPVISFSSLSSNSVYNCTYAGIWGVNSGQGSDANWVKGDLVFGTAPSNGIQERMRITSGGSVLLGTTDTGFNARQLIRFDASGVSTNGLAIWNGGGSGAVFTVFANSGGAFIGSITQVGTTAVAYNITSDYRLKEDLKEIKGLEKISKIKVYDFKWKDDDSRMDGVIAHELQEVVPYAVTGEKDAKEMQQVDYSKLVPILVQAIQELKAEIEILKTK